MVGPFTAEIATLFVREYLYVDIVGFSYTAVFATFVVAVLLGLGCLVPVAWFYHRIFSFRRQRLLDALVLGVTVAAAALYLWPGSVTLDAEHGRFLRNAPVVVGNVDYVRDQVLRPLGMTHTAFRAVDLPAGIPLATPVIAAAGEQGLIDTLNAGRPRKDAASAIAGHEPGLAFLGDFDILPPWGGLEGTAEDVSRFLRMSMGRPLPGTGPVLAPATLAAMRKVQRAANGGPCRGAWGGCCGRSREKR